MDWLFDHNDPDFDPAVTITELDTGTGDVLSAVTADLDVGSLDMTFGADDVLALLDAGVGRDGLARINGTALLTIDGGADGDIDLTMTLTVTGDEGDFVATAMDLDGQILTEVFFEDYQPQAPEAQSISAEALHNFLQDFFLYGDGETEFVASVQNVDAAFRSAIGVYEVNPDGSISNPRIVYDDTGSLSPGDEVSLGVPEEGDRLGFFLIRNGYNRYGEIVGDLTFVDPITGDPATVDMDHAPLLLVDGVPLSPAAVIMHSFEPSLNRGGGSQILASTGSEDGEIAVTFEDLFRSPNSEPPNDIFLTVSAVPVTPEPAVHEEDLSEPTPDPDLALLDTLEPASTVWSEAGGTPAIPSFEGPVHAEAEPQPAESVLVRDPARAGHGGLFFGPLQPESSLDVQPVGNVLAPAMMPSGSVAPPGGATPPSGTEAAEAVVTDAGSGGATPEAAEQAASASATAAATAAPSAQSVSSVQAVLGYLSDTAKEYGPQTLGGAAAVGASYAAAGYAERAVRTSLGQQFSLQSRRFLGSLTRFTALSFMAIPILDWIGVDSMSVAALVGAVGVAVSLGAKGTLTNLGEGILLLIFRPYDIGDEVEIAGYRGTVTAITLFTTELLTLPGERIILNNDRILASPITNFSHFSTRRLDLSFCIAHEDDIEQAVDVIHRVIDAEPRVLSDPAPEVFVGTLSESGVEVMLEVWVEGLHEQDEWDITSELTRRMWEALDAEGLSAPYRQVIRHHRGPSPRKQEPVVRRGGAIVRKHSYKKRRLRRTWEFLDADGLTAQAVKHHRGLFLPRQKSLFKRGGMTVPKRGYSNRRLKPHFYPSFS